MALPFETRTFTIKASVPHFQELRKVAFEREVTVSALVREILGAWLKGREADKTREAA
ncbi:hypothetical protein [Acidisoma sp. C75]